MLITETTIKLSRQRSLGPLYEELARPPFAAQYRADRIISENEGEAEECDAHVIRSLADSLFGCAHQPDELRAGDAAHDQEAE